LLGYLAEPGQRVGLLRQPGEAQEGGNMLADIPVDRHHGPALFQGRGALGADRQGDQWKEDAALLVGQRIVPRPHERADDGGHALRMIGPRLASDVAGGFHRADAAREAFMIAVRKAFGENLGPAGFVDFELGLRRHHLAFHSINLALRRLGWWRDTSQIVMARSSEKITDCEYSLALAIRRC
jgi:hypothetical protein